MEVQLEFPHKHNILWIHGWGMSPQAWDQHSHLALLPEYEHHYASFAECSSPSDFHEGIITKLGHSCRSWTLVGWSMGGMLAMEMMLDAALRERHRIENVVIVSGTPCFINSDRDKGWPLRIVERMRRQLSVQPDETLQQFVRSMFTDVEWQDEQCRSMADQVMSNIDFTIQGLEAGLTYLINTDLTEPLRQYVDYVEGMAVAAIGGDASAAPFLPRWLWIHGAEDQICPLGSVRDLLGDQLIIFNQAGHMPFLSHRQQFYEHLRSFLDA